MKNLIVYFSWSGNTQGIVEKLNEHEGFDVVRVERAKPYSDNYETCAYVEAKEEVEKHIYPAICNIDVDVSKYDNILLFFPIWWYTFPMPIATFLKGLGKFDGKIFVFANSYTNDPQYMQNSMQQLSLLRHDLHFVQGLFNKSIGEHIKFVEDIK